MPQAQLMQSGEFLTLSRQQPSLFIAPVSFILNNLTQVKVFAPGIIGFEPIDYGTKDVVLSCAVHGNETAPIELCDELVKDILLENIELKQRVLVLFANLASIDIDKRFVQENMNRLFSGAHSNGEGAVNEERKRAKLLEVCIDSFYQKAEEGRERFHYDLHTAIRESKNEKFAVYPFLHGKSYCKEQLAFLKKCGITTILLSDAPTTTFSYFSSNNYGAHAFTMELGKVRPFGQNDMTRFTDIDQSLRQLVCGQAIELTAFDSADFDIYQVHQTINRMQEDFALNFADDVPNFTDFPEGYVLASETGCDYKTTQDGEAIVFPNANVALGQRAILTVIPTHI